jgi:exodeoxyribonuclease III
MTTILSWNVNGIRAVGRSGFTDWLATAQPDILCVQETKARPEDLGPDLLEPEGYGSIWHSAQKKGYSGVATYYKPPFEPLSIDPMGVDDFDAEGRVQVLEYKAFTLINAYYPNSRDERARLGFKLDFCDRMLECCERLRRAKKNVIVCGDFNIAHKEIDLARPDDNEDSPGFYAEERAAMDTFIAAGYADTFRHFCPDPGHYTWWSYRTRARERNVGWRIDYFCVNNGFLPHIADAFILDDVLGSDHCPVGIKVKT